MNTLNIAHLTFLEARQRKLLWIIVIIGLVSLALFAVGFYFLHRDVRAGVSTPALVYTEVSNVFLLMGLYGVDSLAVLLAVLVSVNIISGEISSGTIQAIVTKPLRRWEIVLGKWLGLTVMLGIFVVAMSAGMMAIVWFIARYLPPNPVQGVALIFLEALVFLTLSILGGTRLPSLGNGVVVFMLYGLTFIGGWVEQIGSLLQNEIMVNIGIVTSLFVPGEAMWRRAAYLMQPPFLRELGFSPFSAASSPSVAMVLYTAAYIAVALFLALRSFATRDL